MIDAACPKCSCTIAARRFALYGPKYDSTGKIASPLRGWVFCCSRCGTDFCVAGGQVYRWQVGNAAPERQYQPPPGNAVRERIEVPPLPMSDLKW